MKQPAAIAIVPLTLYLFHPTYRRTRGYRSFDSVLQAASLETGFVSVLGVVAVWLSARGLLGEALSWSIGDHDIPHVFWENAIERTLLFAGVCLPLIAGAVASCGDPNIWRGSRAERSALIGLTAVSAVGAAASERFFPHYYIALVPSLARFRLIHGVGRT